MQGMSQLVPAATAQMPEPLQHIFFWAVLVLAAGVAIYAILLGRRHNSLVPPLIVVGTFTSILLEALVGLLGHVTHPSGGGMALFRAVDRTIPWHMPLAYVVGFGIVYLLIYRKAAAGTITTGLVWKTGVITAILYYFGEIPYVGARLWIYSDPSPLWIWKATAPLTWCFMNTSAELFGAGLLAFLLPRLTGARVLLVPVLVTMGSLMGHFGTNFVLFNVSNSDASPLAMELSGVATIGLAMVMWWISAELATARIAAKDA